MSQRFHTHTDESVHQWGILVVAGDINAQEVDVDWVFLPHAVQQHRHLDAVVHGDGDLLLLDDGDPHTETQEVDVSAASRQVGPGAALSQCLCGYPSCVISAVDAQAKVWLFLPSVTLMPVVLTVTPMPSGW